MLWDRRGLRSLFTSVHGANDDDRDGDKTCCVDDGRGGVLLLEHLVDQLSRREQIDQLHAGDAEENSEERPTGDAERGLERFTGKENREG